MLSMIALQFGWRIYKLDIKSGFSEQSIVSISQLPTYAPLYIPKLEDLGKSIMIQQLTKGLETGSLQGVVQLVETLGTTGVISP
jgi:hypothetical protein